MFHPPRIRRGAAARFVPGATVRRAARRRRVFFIFLKKGRLSFK
jgi:hypothetical protein